MQRPEGAEEDQHHVPDHLLLLQRGGPQKLQPGAAAVCQPSEGNFNRAANEWSEDVALKQTYCFPLQTQSPDHTQQHSGGVAPTFVKVEHHLNYGASSILFYIQLNEADTDTFLPFKHFYVLSSARRNNESVCSALFILSPPLLIRDTNQSTSSS